MQKIKLLVLDIDETLMKATDTEVSPANVEAMKKARENGVRVTLATGRLYPIMHKLVEALEIEEPVVAAGGAEIRQFGEVLYRDTMNEGLVKELLEYARERDMLKYLFADSRIRCTETDYDEELFAKWANGNSDDVPVTVYRDMEELLENTQNVQKVLLWAKTPEQHAEVWREVSDKYAGRCSIMCGEAMNVEIYNPHTSKLEAVERIAADMGIALDEVMAIGDSENDIPLLREVGLGVAMENAMPGAKEVADVTTLACEKNGVAYAIEQYILNKR